MKEIVKNFSSLAASWSSSLLHPGSGLLLPPASSAPALISGCSELGGFRRGEGDCLRLDSQELLPARSLLGGDGGWRLSLGSGGWSLQSWSWWWQSVLITGLNNLSTETETMKYFSEYWSLSYPWVLLSWIDSQGGGGGRGSLVLMNWWSWPGWGGGGGDGVHTLPDDDEFLTSVSGEHGGVGSLGFLVLTDLLGAVFFSESRGCNNKERWVLFWY